MNSRKLISLILAIDIAFCCPDVVLAKEDRVLKETVISATQMMEPLIESQMQRIRLEYEANIKDGGYDWGLSMEEFYRQEDPITSFTDMNGLMAALSMAAEKDHIADIDLISYKTSEHLMTESSPVKVERFVEVEKDKYEPDGYYYLTEDTEIPTYEDTDGDGLYEVTDTKKVSPEYLTTPYLSIELFCNRPKDIISTYNLDEKEYKERKKIIKYSGLKDEGLAQSIHINLAQYDTVLSDEAKAYLITPEFSKIRKNRAVLINTATSLIGRIPYLWGGKSKKAGWDDTWWTFNKAGKQRGLDCSGYVQWAYRTAGFSGWEKLGSTKEILSSQKRISQSELKPGDMGLIHEDDGSTNHVGIYLGDGWWIHCSSAANTVTVTKYDRFKVFCRYDGIDTESIKPIADTGIKKASDPDVEIVAKTICHEAAGEGLNCWIAVAEVIRNRIASDKFPDTAEKVIYQDGQFSDNELIEGRNPTPAMYSVARQVLEGNLSMFGNENVLFFRVPSDGSEDD